MIYVAVLEKLFPFLHGNSKQGINVKAGHFEVIDWENKKDAG